MVFTKENLLNARVWPVKQAKRILEHIDNYNRPILLQTGYGPSGTPHLGTATEVIRNFMIAEVLESLNQVAIIIAFCDDMDGMRKIPLNSPDLAFLTPFLGFPLSRVPDPSGQYPSFAEANIQKFMELVYTLGYKIKEYRPSRQNPYSQEDLVQIAGKELCAVLIRASDMYLSGSFDQPILKVLEKHQAILDLILPTLGDERRSTYSPFMPISNKSGKVLEAGVLSYHQDTGEITVKDQDEIMRIPVNGQTCKLQWKVDFGLRWYTLGIDYEMAGKDIEIGTNPISRKVCEILGSEPPVTWMYEMFLASDGTKISKTKNNGVSLDQLLRYMPPSAIRHFMFLSPESAKRLDLSKIPRYIDDFITSLTSFKTQVNDIPALLENPIFYSRNRDLPLPNLSASMVLNLIRGLNFDSVEQLGQHLTKTINNFNTLDQEILLGMYRFYYDEYEKPDFVKLPIPLQKYLLRFLDFISVNGDEMQQHLYQLGNEAVEHGDVQDLKTWFQMIYQSILGQAQGRRLGIFFAACGPEKTHQLITKACDGFAE